MFRSALFVSAGITALVVVLALSAIVFLKTQTGQGLALDAANGFLPGSISLGHLRFSLLRGLFEFQDVSITDPGGEEVVGADRLVLNLAWSDILKGALSAQRLELQRPRVMLRMDSADGLGLVNAFVHPDGKDTPDEPGESEWTGFPLNIVVEDLVLKDGSVTYESADGKTRIAGSDVSLSGRTDVKDLDGDLLLHVGHVILNLPGVRTESELVEMKLVLQKGLADIDVQAETTAGRVGVKGEAELKSTFAGGFLGPQVDLTALTYEALVALEGVEPHKLLEDAKSVQARVNGGLSLTGRGVDPESLLGMYKLDLDAQRVTRDETAGGVDLRLVAEGEVHEGDLILDRFQVKAPGASLEADGRYRFTEGDIKAEIKMDVAGLASLSPLVGAKGMEGSFELHASASGSLKQPFLDLSVKGRDLRYRDVTIGNLALGGTLDSSGILTVSQLALENQGSSVKGSGSLQVMEGVRKPSRAFPGMFKARLRDVDVARFLAKGPVSGILNGEVRVAGNLKSLDARLSLLGRGMAYQGTRIGDLETQAALKGGRLSIERLDVRNRDSFLSVKGEARVLEKESLKPVEDPPFELDIRSDSILLEDLEEDWKGKFSIRAHLQGSPMHPRGTLTIRGSDIDLAVQQIHTVELQGELDGEKIHVNPLRVTVVPGESVECSGWLSLAREYEIKVATGGVSLKNIAWVKDRNIHQGSLALEVSGQGTLDDPNMEGVATLRDLQLNGKVLEAMDIRLDLKDGVAKIQSRPGFDLNASYDVFKKDFSVAARFSETDLAPVFLFLDRGELGGTLTGHVQADGNVAALSEARASLDLSGLTLAFEGHEIARVRDARAFYDRGEASIPDFAVELLEEGEAKISGNVAVDGPVDLAVEGHVPLEVVRFFEDALPDLSGDLKVQARLGGTYDEPILKGQASLEKVAFTIPELMQQVRDLNGSVDLSPGAVTIEQLGGRLDSGRFNLNGKLLLDGFQPTGGRLKIQGRALPVKIPDTLDLLMNTEVSLQGDRNGMVVRGDVVLLEGLYYKDMKIRLIQGVTKREREVAPPPPEVKNKFLNNIGFNVSLKSRQPLLVENNLAELEVRPDLTLSGKLTRPVLSGRAEVVSGTVTYFRKDFVVRKGVIDFLNPYEIEPILDIKSEVKVRRWTVFLNLSGTPEHLSFELWSDPPEEDADIVSLLVAGKTTRELIEGEGGTTKSTQQMLAELVASTFGQDIKKKTGLDILEVETVDEEDESTSDRIKVTVGKKLSRRMTVKYAVETKNGEIVQRAMSDYSLLENILVSGFQDTKGVFGGEVLYRLEFR